MNQWPLLLALAQPLSMPSFTEFKNIDEQKGVVVSQAQADGSIPWMQGTAVIDASYEELYEALRAYASYNKYFHEHVSVAQILQQEGDVFWVYLVWPLPFPMSDRDAVVRYESTIDRNAKTALISWAGAGHEKDPKRALRIEQVSGKTELKEVAVGKTEVRYIYFGDLGGDLPQWVKMRAWREEPVYYIERLRGIAQKRIK
jgi:hypothetical protein